MVSGWLRRAWQWSNEIRNCRFRLATCMFYCIVLQLQCQISNVVFMINCNCNVVESIFILVRSTFNLDFCLRDYFFRVFFSLGQVSQKSREIFELGF